MNKNLKKLLLILLVFMFALVGCAARADEDYLPDTEALPFATPTPIPQLTLKDVPSMTPAPTPSPTAEPTEAPTPDPEVFYTAEDFVYVVNPDGTATITEYTGSEKNLTVPSALDGHTVTAIRRRAFRLLISGVS